MKIFEKLKESIKNFKKNEGGVTTY